MPSLSDPEFQTELGAWLVQNEAAAYAEDFFEKGYKYKADLSNEVIDEIVGKNQYVPKPGLAKTLERLLADDQKKPDKPAKTEAPAIPALPPGTTLDLSQPTLQTPQGVTFSLPSSISVAANNAAVVSPLELADSDWMIIAKNSNLLYAYTMENFADGQPPQASRPALVWVVPAQSDYVRSEFLDADIATSMAYTEETASYVRAGFDRETASGSYAFASASFEREHKERHAHASTKKTLEMIGRWYFPRATLKLDRCTQASPKFVADVRAALASPAPAASLRQVFADYGTAIPKEVTLGGQLQFTYRQTVEGEVDENSVEDTVKAAVSIKAGGGQGSAGGSGGRSEADKSAALKIAENTEFKGFGGDSTMIGSPKDWTPTVKNPRLWAVIARKGVRSTVDLLDPDLKEQVMRYWSDIAVPPAILDTEDLPTRNHAAPAPGAGFLMASREAPENEPGSVVLVCGDARDPQLTDGGAVGGQACVDLGRDADVYFQFNSICLPMPAGKSYGVQLIRTAPATRIAFTRTQLSFGAWQPAFSGGSGAAVAGDSSAQAASDGFLFVTIHAAWAECGLVHGSIDGKRMASAAVHLYERNQIPDASFCLPVPQGSTYKISLAPGAGSPKIRAWWLPVVGSAWKLEKAQAIHWDTELTAETTVQAPEGGILHAVRAPEDGILHAVVTTPDDGDRGDVRLYAWDAGTSFPPPGLSYASVSVHRYGQHNRQITDGYAMLPVRGGQFYNARLNPTWGRLEGTAYWTAIVPRS